MIAAFDVHYLPDGNASAAAVLFERYTDAHPARELTAVTAEAFRYIPGQFYKRELPCILGLIARFEAPPRELIVDGYVRLGARPGLGLHLYEFFQEKMPVIGVAKSRYRSASGFELLRGKSQRPLFVTAAGIDLLDAAARIASMHGSHRIPDLLKRADLLARSPSSPPATKIKS